MSESAPLPPSLEDRPADPEEHRSLLSRIVAGLGIRLVALGGNRQLVVSNLSMRLTGDEHALLVGVLRGEYPPRGR